jgi:hypothetical protein
LASKKSPTLKKNGRTFHNNIHNEWIEEATPQKLFAIKKETASAKWPPETAK